MKNHKIIIKALMIILISSQSLFAQWITLPEKFGNGIRSMHFPSKNTGFAVGPNFSVYKTTDEGNTWNLMPNISIDLIGALTTDIHSVYFISENIGFIAGQLATIPIIFKTEDGGITWKNKYQGNSSQQSYDWFLTSIYFTDNLKGFAAGTNGTFLTTVDGGNTWNIKNVSNNYDDFTALHFADQSTGILISQEALYLTNNGGIDWIAVKEISQVDGKYVNSNIAYTCGYSSAYKTIDGGKTWQSLPVHLNESFTHIFPINQDTVYLQSDKNIYVSSNGGKSWSRQLNSTTEENYLNIYFSEGGKGFSTTGPGSMKYTTNGGGIEIPISHFVSKGKICTDSILSFENSGSDKFTYEWIVNGNTISRSYHTSYKIAPGDKFQVSLVSTNQNYSDTFSLSFNSQTFIPVVPFDVELIDDTVCQGAIVQVNIEKSQEGVYYNLINKNKITSSQIGSGDKLSFGFFYENIQETPYISAKDSNICGISEYKAEIPVVGVPTPDFNLPVSVSEDTVCYNQSIKFTIKNTSPFYTYSLWQDMTNSQKGNGHEIELESYKITSSGQIRVYQFNPCYRAGWSWQQHLNQIADITVQKPRADFITELQIYKINDTLKIISDSDGEKYSWTFGEGASVNASSAVIPQALFYSKQGVKIIRLQTSTSKGCNAKDSAIVYIGEPANETNINICSRVIYDTLNKLINNKMVKVLDYEIDDAGNQYLCGYIGYRSYSYDHGLFVARINPSNKVSWIKMHNHNSSGASSYATTLDVDRKGNVYVGGNFNNINFHINDLYFSTQGERSDIGILIKFDSTGKAIWKIQTSPAYGSSFVSDLVVDENITFIVNSEGSCSAGFPGSDVAESLTTNEDFAIVTINENGNFLKKIAGGTYGNGVNFTREQLAGLDYASMGYCTLPRLIKTSDISFGVWGKYNKNGFSFGDIQLPGGENISNIYYAETDFEKWTDAIQLLATNEPWTNNFNCKEIIKDCSGNIYLNGTSNEGNLFDHGAIFKIASTGEILWRRNYRDASIESISIQGDSLVIFGYTKSNSLFEGANSFQIIHAPNANTRFTGSLDKNGYLVNCKYLGDSHQKTMAIAKDGCGNIYQIYSQASGLVNTYDEKLSFFQNEKFNLNGNCTSCRESYTVCNGISPFIKISNNLHSSDTVSCVGDSLLIRWESHEVKSVNIFYSINSGKTFQPITEGLVNNKKMYLWKIPSALNSITAFTLKIEDADKISVFGIDNSIIDFSKRAFEIKNIDSSYLVSHYPIMLENYIDGGKFYGNGVNNNEFSPLDAGVGSHILQYKVNNKVCTGITYKTIRISNSARIVFPATSLNYRTCKGDSLLINWINYGLEKVDLNYSTDYGKSYNSIQKELPAGQQSYIWALPESLNFHTDIFFKISDSYISAVADSLILINVDFSSRRILNNILNSSYRYTDAPVELVSNVEGGYFNGPGVVNSSFHPNVAGIGKHIIEYNIPDNFCVGHQFHEVNVLPSVHIDIPNGSTYIKCIGDRMKFFWYLYGQIDNIKIEHSADSGKTYHTITEKVAVSDFQLDWTIDEYYPDNDKPWLIRVKDYHTDEVLETSLYYASRTDKDNVTYTDTIIDKAQATYLFTPPINIPNWDMGYWVLNGEYLNVIDLRELPLGQHTVYFFQNTSDACSSNDTINLHIIDKKTDIKTPELKVVSSEDNVTLTWDNNKNVTEYLVYKRIDGEYRLVKSLNKDDTTYVDSLAGDGEIPDYYVIAKYGSYYSERGIPLGLSENETVRNYSIYPNPTNGPLFIHSGSIKESLLKVTDETGNIVLEQKIDIYTSCINLSELDNGIYFIQLIIDGTIYYDKICILK